MSSKDRNEESLLEQRAKRAFDAGVAGLDGRIRGRLAAARARAVERARKPRLVLPWSLSGRSLVPVGAVATAIVAAWIVWQQPAIRAPATEPAVLGDLEILVVEEDFDMLEDLEFYSWLDEQPEMGVPNVADDTTG
jgi:hypothetical protein